MTTSLWDESKINHRTSVVILSAAIAVGSIALAIAIPHMGLSGTQTSHVGGEMVAAVLATIVGISLITTSRSAGQKWMNILGWGFVLVAVLDLVHGLASSSVAVEALGNSHVVADWTSLLSRASLGAFAVFAAWNLEKEPLSVRGRSLILPVTIVVGVVTGTVLIAILQGTNDRMFSPETRLSMLTGLAFLTAFIIVHRRRSQSAHILAAFTVFLLASGAADAVLMFHATETFDGYYSGLHIFKLFAYGTMLIGMLAESQRLHRFEVTARRELGRVNESLNSANLALTTASNDLRVLNKIGRIAGMSRSVEDRFDDIAQLIRSSVDADRIGIGVIDVDETGCRIESYSDAKASETEAPALKPGDIVPLAGSHFGVAILDRKTLVVDSTNMAEMLRGTPRLQSDVNSGIRSWITTPIIAEDEVVGVLAARTRKPDAYSERDSQFVEQIASQLAGLVRQSRTRYSSAA